MSLGKKQFAALRCTVVLLGLVSIFLIQSSPAGARIQIGTLKGAVTDQAGALVSNAGVTLDNSLTGFHRAANTTPQGDYVFNDVPFCARNIGSSALLRRVHFEPLGAQQEATGSYYAIAGAHTFNYWIETVALRCELQLS